MKLEKFSGELTANMNLTILVYGWYNQGNLGDDLFVDAFKSIFPNFNFIFTDHIESKHLQDIDGVFFGGGSFLGEPLKISNDIVFELLKQQKIMYIGVGSETDIHPTHKQLLPLAKLIALRSGVNFDAIKQINANTIVIPDLVYALEIPPALSKISKSILYIPNILVIPKWDEPHWKHAAWDYFKIEIAQVLDTYIQDKYTINFLPFCINSKLNDYNAAAEISNRMNKLNGKSILDKPNDAKSALETISKYDIVITQRFHGTILAEMAGTHCLTIHHHDKLKHSTGARISYYSSSKNYLIEEINKLLSIKVNTILPIESNIFITLKQKAEYALCRN